MKECGQTSLIWPSFFQLFLEGKNNVKNTDYAIKFRLLDNRFLNKTEKTS